MTDGKEATGDSQSNSEIEFLLFRLRKYSMLLEMTSTAVYLITAVHVVLVFYGLMTFEESRNAWRRFPLEVSQITLIVCIAVVIFIRDRFIVFGNDLFQVISDRLESGESKQRSNTVSNEPDSSESKSEQPIRKEFIQTEIRLLLRRFVSLTHLPLLRKSESGEFVYLSFNVVLGIATIILRIILFPVSK